MTEGTGPGESFPWCDCCSSVSMRENRCVAQIPNQSDGISISWRVASGTLLQRNHQIPGKFCDYIAERTSTQEEPRDVYMAVELKSRVQHVGDIVEQLQAGVNALSRLQPKRGVVAILVHSGRMGPQELRALRHRTLTMDGKPKPVIAVRSHTNLNTLG